LSRAETEGTLESEATRRGLQGIVEELRRHGIHADVERDPLRGGSDIYIDLNDLDKLDRLCSEKRLSPEAQRLLC